MKTIDIKILKIIAVTTLLSISTLALSEERELGFYLGATYSATFIEPKNSEIESKKFGSTFAGSILGNYSTNLLTFDLGIGWLTTSVNGDSERKDTFDNQEIGFSINFSEVNISYRLHQNLELGIASKTLFGGESSYAPTVNGQEKVRVYSGLQFLYRYESSIINSRIGLNVLAELTDNNRRNTWVGLVAQIAIPEFKLTPEDHKNLAKKKYKPSKYQHQRVKTVTKIVERIVEKPVELDKRVVVNFFYNRSYLLKEDKQFLEKLSRFLFKAKKYWKKIYISGHTDNGGSIEANINTGWRRARNVEKMLLSSGIDQERIKTSAHSYKYPLDKLNTNLAMSRNRRVEIKIVGISHQKVLEIIDQIKNKSTIPKTYIENRFVH